MSLLEMLLVVCPLVFFASFVDAIAGGGGLISLPAYLLTGMPAHMAIGSNKLSAAVGTAIATGRFLKEGSLHLQIALRTAVFAFVGSCIGAQLALHISDYYLRVVMMVILPCVAVFVLFNRQQMDKESRFEHFSRSRIFLGMMATGLLIGMYDGFFGPGTGTFLILAFTTVLGFDLKRACGNTKIVNLIQKAQILIHKSFARVNLPISPTSSNQTLIFIIKLNKHISIRSSINHSNNILSNLNIPE